MKFPSQEAPSEVITPEFKLHEQYEIPFIWGSLHVTEQAHKAYGLVPLTTQSLESDTNSLAGEEDLKFRTDVWLVGPDELEHRLSPYSDLPFPVISGSGQVRITDKGVEVFCRYNHTDEEMEQLCRELVEAGEVELPGEEMLPELLAQGTHQVIAHSLPDIAAREIGPALQGYLEEKTKKGILSKARKEFLTGLGGGMFIPTEQLLLQGSVDLYGEIASGGLVMAGSVLAYRGIKLYLENLGSVEQKIHDVVQEYVHVVGDDIHRTYCSNHFNHQAREMFGPMPEDL